MCALSISDIYRLEYENHGLGEYCWIHPKAIVGLEPSNARAAALKRNADTVSQNHDEKDFEETPDTLITDYLAKCLEQRKTYVENGHPVPPCLSVMPIEFIDALLYMILELGSSYACYILGSTDSHGDSFFSQKDAEPILTKLWIALTSCKDEREMNLVRDLTLEIFHLGYPWDSIVPRFADALTDEHTAFLQALLERSFD